MRTAYKTDQKVTFRACESKKYTEKKTTYNKKTPHTTKKKPHIILSNRKKTRKERHKKDHISFFNTGKNM